MVTIVALVLGLWVLAAVPMALALGRAASRPMPVPGSVGSVAVMRTEHPVADLAVADGRPLAG